jgi:hypothetical protein
MDKRRFGTEWGRPGVRRARHSGSENQWFLRHPSLRSPVETHAPRM